MYHGRAEATPAMQSVPHDGRLTYDDFLRFPDDGLRHEIIDGEHYVTASPNTRHQLLVGRLYFEIELCLRRRPGIGSVFLAPFDVVFTRWDVVEPDVLFIAADQMDILTDKNVQGAPALVIEVLSASTRDRDAGVKRRLFDRGQVREYWMVDPDRNIVTVLRRNDDGSLAEAGILAADAGETLDTPLVPGLRLRLRDLFA